MGIRTETHNWTTSAASVTPLPSRPGSYTAEEVEKLGEPETGDCKETAFPRQTGLMRIQTHRGRDGMDKPCTGADQTKPQHAEEDVGTKQRYLLLNDAGGEQIYVLQRSDTGR